MGGIISKDTICSILSFVGGEAKYIWGLKDNLDDLRIQKENVIAKKQDLLDKVKLAEQKPRTRRTSTVEQWFARVVEMVAEVENLQRERDQEIDRLCLGGFCSKDLISSYDFGKRVEKMKNKVIELKKAGDEIKEPYEEVPEGAAVPIAVDQTRIVGQDLLLDRVWRCITDQEKNKGIIGLYGTGGVGKTTLLQQVNNKFCSDEQHHFDVVIWSVVSREPNLKQIQEDIGNRIGFSKESWQGKSFEAKARDITNTLQHKKFVLLLDDIWESKIDVTDLGVPLQRLHFGSKIVFTTRFHGTCGEMGADERFEVSYLGDDDAWELFQRVVGRYVLEKHPDIPKLAKDMAIECHGLPLALKTVGQVMSRREYPEEWRSSIETISASASKFENIEEKVLLRLKFSYDSLPKDELRSCLLYCCLFPEDSQIPKTYLIEHWKSEGFLDSISGWDVLGALVRACLLEDGGDRIKMHDMIREMALWIANEVEKEKENFLVRAGVQKTEAPNFEKWDGYKRISLMQSGIRSLPQIPPCPQLQTLLLNENSIAEITDSFFQSLPFLRVLDLRGNYSLTELPVGISSLVSLHHLDLSSTAVRGLPQELKALVNLRYLNLEYTANMSRIPQQLISSFSKLQVLRMLYCGDNHRPIVEEGNVLSDDAELLMEEIRCLEQLYLISLSLHSSRGVENFLKFPKLLNITQALSIGHCESLPLNFLHLANMEHLEELEIRESNLEEWNIDRAGEVQKVLQSGGFGNLRNVVIDGCSNMKDLTWLVFVPNLKWLYIKFCKHMEEIISVEKLSEVSEMMGELNLFAKLEFLYLSRAYNLKRIYHDPLPFPQLNEINIRQCPKLKKLPLNSSSAKERKIVIWGENEWWEELQWEDQATQNAFSPCFLPYKEQEFE